MEVFENLIPDTLKNTIEQTINSDSFPWFFMNDLSAKPTDQIIQDTPKWDTSKVIEPPGLVHMVAYDGKINSNYYDLFRSILYFLEYKKQFEITNILRIRIRRTLQIPGMTTEMYNMPHVDLMSENKFLTLVYCVEESDGDTVFFDQQYKRFSFASKAEELKVIKRIPYKRGNAVLFDGHTYHAGNCPIKHKTRTIINFDFTIKND